MTDFYVLKRHDEQRPKGWNYGLIGGCLFCLGFWVAAIFMTIYAKHVWQALCEFLQKVGLGG